MSEAPTSAFRAFAHRMQQGLDANRTEAVAKRHARGGQTARENMQGLTGHDHPLEYGQLAVAAQRSRRPLEELIRETPGDGVITATARINPDVFPDSTARLETALIINDYTVLAGTQGFFHHRKIDRLLAVARRKRLPVIMFTEGGGGRPGDTDATVIPAGLNVPTFHRWAALAECVPRIAVNHGFCFAGNAALFGAADIRIATRSSWIGMAGPAMIEGGGLGQFPAQEIGPVATHTRNGVVDVLVENEAEGIVVAKKLLSYYQGSLKTWESEDQADLRSALPDNRRMAYDVRHILTRLFDRDSITELKPDYGRAVVTGFARIQGQACAFVASDCRHLGGAIDCEAADKLADFFGLANTWKLPLVSFVDTPGFMVGPDSESAGAPRAMSRVFTAAAKFAQPLAAIFLRRGYGLGAMAMAGGAFDVPVLAASWPEGEFGAMGLEGAVTLGYRQELEAVPEGPEREALYEQLVTEHYERGRATEFASYLEIDAVIDPTATRGHILQALWG